MISINAIQIGLSYWYYEIELDGKNKFNKFLYGTISLIGYQILSSSKIYLILNNKYMMQKDIISACNISYLLTFSFLINVVQFISIIGFIHIFQDDADLLYTNIDILINASTSINQSEIFGITISFCIILIVSKMFIKIVKYIMFHKQINYKILFLLLFTYFSYNENGIHNIHKKIFPSLGRDIANKSASALSQYSQSTIYYLPTHSSDTNIGFTNTNYNGNLSTISILDIISRTVWIIFFIVILEENTSIILLACYTLLIIVIYVSYRTISESLFSNEIFSFLTFLHNSSSILLSDIDSILLTITYKFYANMKLYLHIVRNRRDLLTNSARNKRPRIRNKNSISTRSYNRDRGRYLQKRIYPSDDDEDETKTPVQKKSTIDSIQINDIIKNGNGHTLINDISKNINPNTYTQTNFDIDTIRNITPPPTSTTPNTITTPNTGNNTHTSNDLNIIQYRGGNTFTDTVKKLESDNNSSSLPHNIPNITNAYSHGNLNDVHHHHALTKRQSLTT